jgi:hypothetical protein
MDRPSPAQTLVRLFRDRRIIGPIIFIGAGQLFYYFSQSGYSLEEFWKERGPQYVAMGLMAIGIAWFYLEFFAAWMARKNEAKFADVDARWRDRTGDVESERILEEIRHLREGQQTIDYERLAALLQGSSEKRKMARSSQLESFSSYFDSLSALLEEQAKIADEKASILLDKGTSYSRNGIAFFFATIVGWQLVTAIYGFQIQHIYGIASCSLLFVFIEFLSAWFLKQYRHYVDTSTYLLKVKSIFDRYMLSYLVLSTTTSDEEALRIAPLASLLSEDIKWPETYLLKSADIGFAKDALETVAVLVKSMKAEAKEKSELKKTRSDA